jgi:putative transposase
VHQDSRGTYGALRVHAELQLGHGIMVGHNAIALLMRRAGLAGATGRPKWRHAKPDQIAADLVDRQFSRSGPNQLWVTDIERHEVLLNRAVVKGHRLGLVAASH